MDEVWNTSYAGPNIIRKEAKRRDEVEQSETSRSGLSDGPEVEKVLEDLIRSDDKNGFVSFVRRYSENDSFRSIQNMLNAGDIMMWICSYSAEGCATALLEGETGLSVDLNVPLRNGYYPLQLVAEKLCSPLTNLFLSHGARTNLHCSIKESKYFGMLPLNAALEALRCHKYLSDWNPTKSIFKLIYCLCFPELHEPLETVKLISENTSGLEKITCCIVQEGKIVELAALLFVAWDKLLIPTRGDDVDSSVIGQCITNCLASLIDQEYKLINSGRNLALSDCRKMQVSIASASLMLTVFERGGELLDKFRLVCFRYASFAPNYKSVRSAIIMLKQLGFALKREDTNLSDMLCFRIGMDPRHEEKLRRSIDRIMRSRQCQVTSTSFDVRKKQKELVSNNLAVHHLVQPPFSLRAFHTCWIPSPLRVPKLCCPAKARHRVKDICSKQSNFIGATRGQYYGLTLMGFKDKIRLVSRLI